MPIARYMDSNGDIHEVDYTITPIDLNTDAYYTYTTSTTATTSGAWTPVASGVWNYHYAPVNSDFTLEFEVPVEETYPVSGGVYEDAEKEIPPI